MPFAVERGQCALEKGHRHRRPHVDPGVEQFARHSRCTPPDLVEPRPQPVEPAVDRCRLVAWQGLHLAAKTVRAGNRFGYSETGRSTLVSGIVAVPALAFDQRIDQLGPIQFVVHLPFLLGQT